MLCFRLFPPLCSPRSPAALLPTCPRPQRRALSWRAGAGHLPSPTSSGSGSEVKVSRPSPEPRRPSDYISRYKQAGRSRAGSPTGLGVELHLPHSSLFPSLLPACISLLQLHVITEWVITEWAGTVAGTLGQGGEWGTGPAPQTQRKTLELLVKMSAREPGSPRKAQPPFLTAKKQ